MLIHWWVLVVVWLDHLGFLWDFWWFRHFWQAWRRNLGLWHFRNVGELWKMLFPGLLRSRGSIDRAIFLFRILGWSIILIEILQLLAVLAPLFKHWVRALIPVILGDTPLGILNYLVKSDAWLNFLGLLALLPLGLIMDQISWDHFRRNQRRPDSIWWLGHIIFLLLYYLWIQARLVGFYMNGSLIYRPVSRGFRLLPLSIVRSCSPAFRRRIVLIKEIVISIHIVCLRRDQIIKLRILIQITQNLYFLIGLRPLRCRLQGWFKVMCALKVEVVISDLAVLLVLEVCLVVLTVGVSYACD